MYTVHGDNTHLVNVDISYSSVGVETNKEEAVSSVGILHSISDPQSLFNCNEFIYIYIYAWNYGLNMD